MKKKIGEEISEKKLMKKKIGEKKLMTANSTF